MTLIYVPVISTRSSGTAAATTQTLASPTVGGSSDTSLWRVRMTAGSAGPLHIIDSEQIWTVLAGSASIRSIDGELTATVGDTVIMPANVERGVTALDDCEFLVCGSPSALATIPGNDAEPVSPPWVR